jgi:hypothetical protein
MDTPFRVEVSFNAEQDLKRLPEYVRRHALDNTRVLRKTHSHGVLGTGAELLQVTTF